MNESSRTHCENFTTTPGSNRRSPHAAFFGDIVKEIGKAEGEDAEMDEQAHDETSSTNEETSEDRQAETEVRRKAVGFCETQHYIYELGFNGTETYFIRYNFATGRWENYIKEIPVRKESESWPLLILTKH